MRTNQYAKKISFAVMAGMLFVSACTKYAERTSDEIETTLDRTSSYLERAPIPQTPLDLDTVTTKDDIWLGETSVKMTQGDPLPAWLEKSDGITLVLSDQLDLSGMANQITLLTGLPVRLEEIKSNSSGSSQNAGEGKQKEAVSFEYVGKLSGLLDQIATKYGVWWRYKNGTISFYSLETRVFTLYALPVDTTLSASLQGASTSQGGQGAATSSLSSSANLSLWSSIESGLNQLVSEGGSISTSPVTGTVTVTAPPFTIRKVAQYVRDLNEKMSRQVAISVQILQVTLNNDDQYGLDLKPIFKNASLSASAVSPYSIDPTGSAGLISMALVNKNSKFNGTQGIIQALSIQGKTSLVTSTSVTTLNNKVAPVQVATSENYVSETRVETTGSGSDVSTSLELSTDTLNYGFTMEILPRILDHGRLIILFTMTLTDLISLETFPKGGAQASTGTTSEEDGGTSEEGSDNENSTSVVQLPKMQTRGFVQEIAMRSGSTLILTGFEQLQNTVDSAGIGQPKMSLLGGRAYSTNKRSVLVVLLTPEVLESPLSPESRMTSTSY